MALSVNLERFNLKRGGRRNKWAVKGIRKKVEAGKRYEYEMNKGTRKK
jgi:hypothetical protein